MRSKSRLVEKEQGWGQMSNVVAGVKLADVRVSTARYFNIAEDLLVSNTRRKQVVIARQISMFVARDLTAKSLPKIAADYHKKDHTTVIFACRKITKALENVAEVKIVVTAIAELAKERAAKRLATNPAMLDGPEQIVPTSIAA
jgi:chromosomal replication initiation ATPase DnaA